MSVCGSKTKAGVRYVQFGCTAHSSRGGSICANGATISERKITEALVAALHDVLTGPEVTEAFARAFERRVAERARVAGTSTVERDLRAAETRVANATRLLVEMPDDLDLRSQRATDQNEVRRLQAVMAADARANAPRVAPDRTAIQAVLSDFLDVVASQAPERGREVLAKCMTPLTLTPAPKTENPGLVVTGVIDLAKVVASGRSGGRI